MSIPFDDTSSISSISTISTTFGEGSDEPCSWLGPLIGVIGVVLLGVLIYYWVCDGQRRKEYDRRHRENPLLPIRPYNNNQPEVALYASADTNWSGQIEDIDGQKADAKIKGHTKVVIAFLAQGCSWCTKLQPELHKAAKQSKTPIYTVHASKAGPLLKNFKINGFPHVMLFENGKVKKVQPGYTTADKLLNLCHS